MTGPDLTEYLFLDKARIESYFQQISDPVAYDKTPMWKAGLSLTGPTAEATQSRTQRAFTDHEKAVRLLKYLDEHSLVRIGRLNEISAVGQHEPFFVETMSAVRIGVEPGSALAERRSVFLWVSETPSGAHSSSGPLILIEDYLGADDERVRRHTSYSYLLLLADTLDTGPDHGPGYIDEAGLYKQFHKVKSFDEDANRRAEGNGGYLGPNASRHSPFPPSRFVCTSPAHGVYPVEDRNDRVSAPHYIRQNTTALKKFFESSYVGFSLATAE